VVDAIAEVCAQRPGAGRHAFRREVEDVLLAAGVVAELVAVVGGTGRSRFDIRTRDVARDLGGEKVGGDVRDAGARALQLELDRDRATALED